MSDSEEPDSKRIDPWKKFLIIACALIGAGAGAYYHPNAQGEWLFWGALLGALAGEVIWTVIEG